jgi:8-oxo-dGTP diphosphatase
MPQDFKFCPHCATVLDKRIIHSLERLVCSGCGFVFWQNPIVGVAVIILDEQNRLLLGRRSRGIYEGQWCIPCGYVESDEHVRDAAQREFLEETGLEVQVSEVYTVHSNFHNPKVPTVGIWFRGTIIGGELAASDDLDAVDYVSLASQENHPLAFPTDELVVAQLRKELVD